MRHRSADPKYCSILTLHKEKALITSVSFAIQKNSKWNTVISQSILKLKSELLLSGMINKWFHNPDCNKEMMQASEFPWEYVSGMIVCISCFAIFSAALLMCETYYTRVKTSRKDANNMSVVLTKFNKKTIN